MSVRDGQRKRGMPTIRTTRSSSTEWNGKWSAFISAKDLGRSWMKFKESEGQWTRTSCGFNAGHSTKSRCPQGSRDEFDGLACVINSVDSKKMKNASTKPANEVPKRDTNDEIKMALVKKYLEKYQPSLVDAFVKNLITPEEQQMFKL